MEEDLGILGQVRNFALLVSIDVSYAIPMKAMNYSWDSIKRGPIRRQNFIVVLY